MFNKKQTNRTKKELENVSSLFGLMQTCPELVLYFCIPTLPHNSKWFGFFFSMGLNFAVTSDPAAITISYPEWSSAIPVEG